ncbi:MAG: DUF2993 domain-containing protein [Fibrella sp.]|nr:DUF2993 domain-containing protein [Armatimonadota bacterium]
MKLVQRAPPPAIALPLLIFLTGCNRPVETRAEHAITDVLPRYLGPAEKYTARVSGRPDAIYRGRLRSVHIEGTNVQMLPNLLVSRLVMDVKDVSVDRGNNTLQNVGETRFSARLTEAAINGYVRRRETAPPDLAISLGADGKATVTTRPELLGFSTIPVSLRGTVRLQGDGKHLEFQPDKASVDVGIGTITSALPGFVADHIASQVNPVADLSTAPFPIIAESVTVEQGAATIMGYVPPGELQKILAEVGNK